MYKSIKNRKLVYFSSSLFIVLAVFLFFIPEKIYAEKLYEVLKQGAEGGGPGEIIANVWKSVINLVNILVGVVLIYVAFANILRININNYSIKKILPTLLFAVIAANFSFLFCRFFVDLGDVAYDLLINGGDVGISLPENIDASTTASTDATMAEICPEDSTLEATSANIGIASGFCFASNELKSKLVANGHYDWAVMGKFIFYTIVQFAGAICILILAFLFYIRNYVIYFLVAISPLAFMSIILPLTKQGWNMWWSNFWKWNFLPLTSLFWLWLGGKWMSLGVNTDGMSIMSMIFAGACYYMAIISPFKLGGNIMQAWGSWGKKIWGATGGQVGAGVKRRAWRWWGEQLKGKDIEDGEGKVIGNRVNLWGRIGRGYLNIKDREKFIEEQTSDIMNDKVRAAMARTNRGTRQREVDRQKFGGEHDRAKKEAMADYQETEEGRKWMEARQKWLDNVANLDTRIQRNYNQGKVEFRKSEAGKNLAEEQLRLDQYSKQYEDEIKAMEKELMTQFLSGKGRFETSRGEQAEENRRLISNRIAFMGENLALDEAIKKSQQDQLDIYFGDQLHLQSIKERQDDYEKFQELYDRDRTLNNLDGNEQVTLQNLTTKLGQRFGDGENQDAIMVSIREDQQAIQEHLRGMIADREQKALGSGHIEKVIDTAGGQIRSRGFEKLARGMIENPDDNEEGVAALEKILLTRTGKLMSIEIEGDVGKIMKEKTAKEMVSELNINNPNLHRALKTNTLEEAQTALTNFKDGRQYLNNPEVNREIEVRNIALAQIARQKSHAEARDAAEGFVQMLSDDAARAAATEYNTKLTEYAESTFQDDDRRNEYITNNTIPGQDADAIRNFFKSRMLKGDNDRTRDFAFGAVFRQPTMGLSGPSSAYLSGSFIEPAGTYRNPQSGVDISPQSAVSMSKKIAEAMAQNNTNSFSQLAKALGGSSEKMASNLESIRGFLNSAQTDLPRKFATALGMELKEGEATRLRKILASLPTGLDEKGIVEAIRKGLPNSNPTHNPGIRISLAQPTGEEAEVSMSEAVQKAHNLAKLEQGVELLDHTETVSRHAPYLQTFRGRSPGEVQNAYSRLTQARAVIENTDLSTEDRAEAARNALRDTSLRPADEIANGNSDTLFNSVVTAHQAALASISSFDEDGRLDIDRATDTLVEQTGDPKLQHEGLVDRDKSIHNNE